jgi:hypothetical protein
LLVVVYFLYPKIERTKVVLKCTHQKTDKNNFKEDIVNYYKITNKLFDTKPYKLYMGYASMKNDEYVPYLDGYWQNSEEVKNSKQLSSSHQDISKYYYPEWYTFISFEKNAEGKYEQKDIYSTFNRETLQYISHFYDLPSFESKCEISDEKHFDESFQESKNKQIKNKKI